MRTLPEFVAADPASPAWRSPLRRALAGAPAEITDVTSQLDAQEVAQLGPAAGIAGIGIDAAEAERVVRRLTDLELDALPALGAVAHVPALVIRDAPGRFRLWFPQEYADYFAAVVLDTWAGLR